MDREERLRRRREQARLRTETIQEALILPCKNRSGHATLHTNHSHNALTTQFTAVSVMHLIASYIIISGTKQHFSKTRKLCIVANYCMLAYLVQARPTMLLASV